MSPQPDSSSLMTPTKRAKGLGSAKSGVHHWIAQRLTALALIPLCLWFVVLVLRFFTCDTPMEMIRMIVSPLNTVLFVTLIGVMLYHGMLGMVVVIEDYIHCRVMRITSLVLLYGVTLLTGVVGISAVIMAHVTFFG